MERGKAGREKGRREDDVIFIFWQKQLLQTPDFLLTLLVCSN